MRYASTEELRRILAHEVTVTDRPVYRPVRRRARRIMPRAIQWHIDRELFSPCAY
jgi:hypothetical protein